MMMWSSAPLLLLLAVASGAAKKFGTLKSEAVEGICDTSVKSQSGYYSVSSGKDKNYFYWYTLLHNFKLIGGRRSPSN